MNRFDKLKVVVESADHIDNLDMSKFKTIIKDGTVTAYQYQQTKHHSLYIEKDLADDEVVIEFTGKILGANYPELINKTNIRQCLENINALGICTLDIDDILSHGKVVKADVTIDAEYPDMPSLTTELQSCVKNNKRYEAYEEDGNFIIRKKVKTKNRKLRLIIYDKGTEMEKADNKRWLSSLGNAAAERITNYFQGKIRFEMNLTSLKAIKDQLNINDNSISSVINSEYNPIMPFLDMVLIDNNNTRVAQTVRDLERLAFMEKYDYDMKAIEREVRSIIERSKKKTKPSQPMEKYHLLYNALHSDTSISLKERLKKALLEIFIIGFVLL